MAAMKILVVDDHKGVRTSIRDLLTVRSDWTVCGEAGDGRAAVEKARALRPDLVLMDVSMPVMDGIEATRIIRREMPEMDVVIVSQNDPKVVSRQAAEVGARAFVSKEYLGRDLVPVIERIVDDKIVNGKIVDEKIPGEKVAADAPPTNSERVPAAGSETMAERERLKALLAAIVDSSDDAIVSKNLDGVITSWNKSAERIFGYTAQEAVGQHITLIIPGNRLDEEKEIIARLRRGERVDHFQTVRVRKDGSTIDVSLTISPVRDVEGRVIGASKVARDITAQRRAEERERQITAEAVAATAKFRAVFEQTTVFAGIISKDGKLVEANKISLEACGYRAENELGRPFWKTGWWRNFPESQEKIRAATARAARGIPYREMLKYSWADDTERLVDFALYPILDDKNEVLFLHPTGVDITDLKRAEENFRKLAHTLEAEVNARTQELEDRNAEVLRQSEMLREFSQRLLQTQDEERRHIARELHDSAGQTLTVLGLALAELVEKVGKRAPEIGAEAKMIEETVQQLHREIRTTTYLLHPPLLDETGLSSALGWYTQGIVNRSGLEIRVDITKDLGRLPHEMELAIFRIVQECLTNIIRHSGSKTASIRVDRDADAVTVDVRDQGQGMPARKLAAIQSGATGLGVRGMRERVRQFAGNMSIESSNAGTRILVTIPIPKGSVIPEEESGTEPVEAAA